MCNSYTKKKVNHIDSIVDSILLEKQALCTNWEFNLTAGYFLAILYIYIYIYIYISNSGCMSIKNQICCKIIADSLTFQLEKLSKLNCCHCN